MLQRVCDVCKKPLTEDENNDNKLKMNVNGGECIIHVEVKGVEIDRSDHDFCDDCLLAVLIEGYTKNRPETYLKAMGRVTGKKKNYRRVK